MKIEKIGYLPAVSIVVANMVGVGVFTSLGFQLFDLHDYRSLILIWFVGGILALLGSFCYSELSASFPKSGGEYHFLRLSFGNHIGFLSGWTSAILGFAAPIAAAAHAFAKYFTNVVNTDLNPLFISSILILLITLIHFFSISVGSRFQVYFTIGKIVLLLFFIIAGLYLTPIGIPVADKNGTPLLGNVYTDLLDKGFWIGLIYVSYAYSGWNASAYMIDDIKNPTKNVPRSIISGTVVVLFLYTLVNYVFLKSSPADELMGKEDVAYIAADHIFGNGGALIISSLISFFLISTISSMIIVGPRVIKRISDDYQSFKFFAPNYKNNIPQRALLLQSSVALLILLTSSFDFIVTSIGFVLSIFTTLTAAGSVIMRIKQPHCVRPVKMPFFPLPALIYCFFNIWIIYFTLVNRPYHALSGLIFLLIGSLIYFLFVRRSANIQVVESK